jgi:lysylphosphatidylglycerol synthetase-like protein (DUF2156 family)
MEKGRFPALHVVSAIFKIMAWLVAVGDIIAIVVILTRKTQFAFFSQTSSNFNLGASPLVLAVIALVLGAFYFLVLYALAEGIMVAVAIEENTRKLLKEKEKTA